MRIVSRFFPLLLALGAVSVAGAQVPDALPDALVPDEAVPEVVADAVPVEPDGPGARLTADDVGAWLDGFLPYALARGDIAGAVVTVVKDGEVLVNRGYGHADVATRTPVDPERTLFRPGSVSKLVTWTAVMQLVEQGKLDLDTDVNTYLDFNVPAKGAPITLRHVLTHTTGLEERIKGLMSHDPDAASSLGDYLKRWVPAQMYAPGSTPAYSNYATSLAGYIVERASGMSFDDYVDQRIFAPLGMRDATFRQPLPERLQAQMSSGYGQGSGEARQFEVVPSAPAGSLSASGADMARFMIAHLRNGAGEDSPILAAATAATMYEQQTVFTPPLNTMALGFYESNVNGRRVLSHGGDTQWFHSNLNLFMDEDVGLFLSFNSAGKAGVTGPLREAIFRQFADRYFPATGEEAPAGVDEATAARHARLLAGSGYENTRRSHSSSFARLFYFGRITFSIHDDGTVSAKGVNGTNGEPIRWREVAPLLWEDDAGSGARMAAVLDDDGGISHWSVDAFSGFMQFEPVPAWRSTGWIRPLLGLTLASLALSALAWPLAALLRRRYGQRLDWPARNLRVRRWARIAAWLIVGLWAAWVAVLAYVSSDYTRFGDALDKWIVLLSALGWVVAVGGTAAISWHAWLSWTSRRGWLVRLWNGWLVAAALLSAYVALVFGLLSFSTQY